MASDSGGGRCSRPTAASSSVNLTSSSALRQLPATYLGSAYGAVVGACAPASVLAFSAKLAPLRVSVAIDTGSSVNILDLDTYHALRRKARGGRYALRPSDLTLTGGGSVAARPDSRAHTGALDRCRRDSTRQARGP